jgi:hypothetical protein
MSAATPMITSEGVLDEPVFGSAPAAAPGTRTGVNPPGPVVGVGG